MACAGENKAGGSRAKRSTFSSTTIFWLPFVLNFYLLTVLIYFSIPHIYFHYNESALTNNHRIRNLYHPCITRQSVA